MGRATIGRFRLEPDIPCLDIQVNNCNGGMFNVRNNCKAEGRLGSYPLRLERRVPTTTMTELRAWRTADGVVGVSAGEYDASGRWHPATGPQPSLVDGRLPGSHDGKPFVVEFRGGLPVKPGALKCLELDGIRGWGAGWLQIKNLCPGRLTLAGRVIRPFAYVRVDTEFTTGLELFRRPDGTVDAREAAGSYAAYAPEKDEPLALDGVVGGKAFRVSYVKSRPQCPPLE